jgi:hypothetical protein
MMLLSQAAMHGQGSYAGVDSFDTMGMYGDGMNLYAYLGGNPWGRRDPLGLSWDPFSMVDDFLAETAGSRAALLGQLGQSAKATAIVAATIASYLPFPIASMAGDLALVALGEQTEEEMALGLAMGAIPGGKLLGGLGNIMGRIGGSAWSSAKHYASKYTGALGSKVNGLFARAKSFIRAGCGCLSEETLVWTTGGIIAIKDVRVGTIVLAQDDQTQLLVLRTVTAVHIREEAPILNIAVRDGGHAIETIEVTGDHWIFITNSGWQVAEAVGIGDRIVAPFGEVEIVGISFTGKRQKVYNLEVDGVHRFHVGRAGALVHNGLPCARPLTRKNFNHNLNLILPAPPGKYHAHHLIPHRFQTLFPGRNLNDPAVNGAWVHEQVHIGRGSLTDKWEAWAREHPNATAADVLQFADRINSDAALWIIKP